MKAGCGEGAGVKGSIAGARVIMSEVIPELGWTCAWGSGYRQKGHGVDSIVECVVVWVVVVCRPVVCIGGPGLGLPANRS